MALSPTSFNRNTSGVQRWGRYQYINASSELVWSSDVGINASVEYYPTSMLGTTYYGGDYGHYGYTVSRFRVKFTTDASGCSSVTWKLSSASGSYTSNSYAYAITSTTSTPSSWTNVTAAQETAKQGTISVKLLPNTVYYFWMRQTGDYACDLGNLSLTGSGTYGAPGNITANNANFGEAVTMSYASSTSGATYTVTTSVPKTGSGTITETLQTKASTSSRTWTPAFANYAPYITDAKSVTCTITVQTYFGNDLAGTKTKTITLSFTEAQAAPTLAAGAFTIAPLNESPVSGLNGYIQGYSKIRAGYDNTKATYVSGASFASFSVVFGAAAAQSSSTASANIDSDAITDTTEVVCTLTDSRGFTASQTLTATIIPYVMPALPRRIIQRTNAQGEEASDGTYLKVDLQALYASVDNQNSVTVTVGYKLASASTYTEETLSDMTIATSGTNKTASKSKLYSGLQDKVYDVQVIVADALGNTFVATATIPSDSWVIHAIGGGAGIGLGKAAENANEVEIPAGWEYMVGTDPVVGTHAQNLTQTQKDQAISNLGIVIPAAQEFLVDSFASSNTTVNGTSNAAITLDVTKTGYAALGVVGVVIERGSTSSTDRSPYVVLRNYVLGGAQNTSASVNVRNTNSSSASVKVTVYILYQKA